MLLTPEGPVPTDAPLDDLVFTARDDLVVETIDGECLVLDLDRNVYFGLNPLGLSIWEAIATASSTGSGPRAIRSARVGPSISSRTRAHWSPVSATP